MVGVSFSGKVDQGLAHLLGQRGRSMVLGVGAFDVAFEVIADHDNAGITGFERDTVFVFDFGSLVGEGVTTVEADGEYVAILHLWIPSRFRIYFTWTPRNDFHAQKVASHVSIVNRLR
jgi:hypothetical protein